MNLDIQSIARAMGGHVVNGAALVPGPGHKPFDRSLSIKLRRDAADGFVVHSFAGDDPIRCKDYAREKLGLPQWEPAKTDGRRSNGNGSNGYHHSTARPAPFASASRFPEWTPPGDDGKPRFHEWGDDGPPDRGELRRHVYRRDGVPVRIKIKNAAGAGPAFVNWYRVTNSRGVAGWQAKKPAGYHSVPYVGALNPFDRELASDVIFWTEGEKDSDTLGGKINLPAFTFGGCGDGLPDDMAAYLKDRQIVILADNDEPGLVHAEKKAAAAQDAGAASIKVLHFPELADHGDVSDFVALGRSADDLTQRADNAPTWQPRRLDHQPTPPGDNRQGERSLVVVNAASVEMIPVAWLWPGKVALGKLCLVAGEPGLGKSQLTAALTAVVTAGGRWPCSDDGAPRGSVVIFSAEDDASDTIVPRLKAAGAALDRVRIVSAVKKRENGTTVERSFNLQVDLDLLETAIGDLGDVRLIIIDPLTSYLGKVDGNSNSDIRGVLEPAARMAARHGAAVVGITHFSKGGGASALNRFIGSIGFIAAARSAFVVTTDPDSDDPARRLFIPVKNNLAPLGDGLSFRIEQTILDSGIVASRVEWGSDTVTKTADEILQATAGTEDSPARTEAEGFLRAALASGPRPSKDIEADAKGAGISWRTVNRAKKALGVTAEPRPIPSDKPGDGPPLLRWFWSLPTPSMPPSAQGCHVSGMAALGRDGILGSEGGEP